MKKFYFSFLCVTILLLFSPLLTAQYCIPTFSSGCGLGDDIEGFVIEDSNGNLILNHLNTGCSSNAYGDFTQDSSLIITLDADATYNFTITTNYSGSQHQRIWIDFNENESFEDAGELVFSSTSASGSANPTVGSFTVPDLHITTRLRVMNRFSALPNDSCTPGSSFGETHDYTIVIVGENEDCYSPNDLDMDNLTATSAEFSWTASADETNGYYWVVMASGDDPDVDLPLQDGNTATGIVTATATQLSQNTSYSVYVQTDCGSEISIWEGPLDFTTPIVPPANDECIDAIPLAIGIDFDDMPFLGNNLGATNDSNDPVPTCDAFNFATNGKDVWYTVDVPALGNFSVETRTNNYAGMNNTGMEIFSGTCGNITLIECNANDGDGNFSLIELSGHTPGETLLVRVWGYNNDAGEFLISAYGDPLPCDMPSDVSLVDVQETVADFSWSASPTETNGYVWAVMADGENPDTDTYVQSEAVGTGITTATVMGLSQANYYDFYVRADCDSDGMSYWEGPLSFTTATASVNDHELEGFTFYPNQMDDVLYISAKTEIEKVMIFNLNGQKLIEQGVGGTNTQIDVSHFASALYFMQVITAKGNVGTYNLIKK